MATPVIEDSNMSPLNSSNPMISSTSTNNSSAAGEVVYGSGETGESRVMSERVQQMAGSIYKEFEHMIQSSGEDGVKDLMPLVVNVLESLDMAYLEKEENSVELELLKEDNEQLVTQYEREKQLRRQVEQKCLEIEDHLEEEQKGLEGKIESLESIVRMLELKSKNANDHANRLEERETEAKTEYQRLHERYTDLFKTHMDYMERTKFLMGNEKFEMMQNMPAAEIKSRLGAMMAASVDGSGGIRSASDMLMMQSDMTKSLPLSAEQSLATQMTNEEWADELSPSTASEIFAERDKREAAAAAGGVTSPRSQATTPRTISESTEGTKREDSVAATVSEADTLGADLTGGLVDPAEFASAGAAVSPIGGGCVSSDEEGGVTSGDSVTGMGREVENLIKENTELMETKNALNIVKNDLIARVDELSSEQDILREEIRSLEIIRTKLNEKIKEFEEESKANREELEKARNSHNEEDDVPMAQRKRFTRVEMARVLMERNQYKEKLFELQEAVKFTEMVRAKKAAERTGSGGRKKNGGSIWDFFSGLFGDGASSSSANQPSVRYLARNSDPITRKKAKEIRGKKTLDFLDPDYSSEKRAAERKEQYKLVKAHVKKDESGRFQAYGWSIPAMDNKQQSTTVPVPIFCRPLVDQEKNLKIWCATGVQLSGGRTKDGGYIVGAGSVFYSQPSAPIERPPPAEKETKQAEYWEFEAHEWESTGVLWVCSSAHGRSQVAIVDANNPHALFDAFPICNSHLLCVASVPGVKETDYPISDLDPSQQFCREAADKRPSGIDDDGAGDIRGRCIWAPLTPSEEDPTVFYGLDADASPVRHRSSFSTSDNSAGASGGADGGESSSAANTPASTEGKSIAAPVEDCPVPETVDESAVEAVESSAEPAEPSSNLAEEADSSAKELPAYIKDGLAQYDGIEAITTALPTIWMGSQSGQIFIHSAVSQWRKCLRTVKLADAVLGIVHYKGRVFAAMANGMIAVFHRDASGEWSTAGYHLITVGKPQTSVRCITVVAGRVWCGYRNSVFVFDTNDLSLVTGFTAHPRKDSQVRQLVWIGDGVWTSIRLDSTLRLYHAHTCKHLQDVDIEPYVTKMLGTNKLGFSFIRTTAMLVSCRRLWIGTGTGVVISVPLSETNQSKVLSSTSSSDGSKPTELTTDPLGVVVPTSKGPGGLIRVYSDPSGGDAVAPGTFIPYCNMAQAQLSFHGHKDAVKFFVAVPGCEASVNEGGVEVAKQTKKEPNTTEGGALAQSSSSDVAGDSKRMLVVSGGDGYIDFRVGEDDEEAEVERSKAAGVKPRDMPHLIVWEMHTQTRVPSRSPSVAADLTNVATTTTTSSTA